MQDVAQLIYLFSAVLFILGLKRMTRVKSARSGNLLSAVAMLLAVIGALIEYRVANFPWILVGAAIGGLIGAYAATPCVDGLLASPPAPAAHRVFSHLFKPDHDYRALCGATPATRFAPTSDLTNGIER